MKSSEIATNTAKSKQETTTYYWRSIQKTLRGDNFITKLSIYMKKYTQFLLLIARAKTMQYQGTSEQHDLFPCYQKQDGDPWHAWHLLDGHPWHASHLLRRWASMASLVPIEEISESESAGEPDGPARHIVLQRVDTISSSAEDDEPHLPRQGARRKRLKRKRSTDLPSMRERLTSESCLKKVLTKKCIKCKFGCRDKFSEELKFQEWRKFREHWVSLSKIDQDQIVTWNEKC